MRILVLAILSFFLVSCATYNIAGTIGVKDLNCDPEKNIEELTSANSVMSVTYDINGNTATVKNTSTNTLQIDKSSSFYIDNKENITALNISDDNPGNILSIRPYSSAKIKLPAHSCSVKISGYKGNNYQKKYSFNNSVLTSQYAFSYSFDTDVEKKYWRDGLYLAQSEFNSNKSGDYYARNNRVVGHYENKMEIGLCTAFGLLCTVGGALLLSTDNKPGDAGAVVCPVLGGIFLACGIAISINIPIAIIRDKRSGYSISVDL